jgi:23S rRNA (guanosine2251-2'-O)-methyltransferase
MIDLIIGNHGIVEAINNPNRKNKKVVGTKEAIDKLFGSNVFEIKVDREVVSQEELKKRVQQYCQVNNFASVKGVKVFLQADTLGETHVGDIYDQLKERPMKFLALDDITDVHNFGAILRTAVFYGVDAVFYSQKEKRFPPGFFRIASGAPEHIKLVNLTSLSKGLSQLQKRDVVCLGFSEHEQEKSFEKPSEASLCLVLGSEERGISNAVKRIIDACVAIESCGPIKSLNVSVASAIAMERFFTK